VAAEGFEATLTARIARRPDAAQVLLYQFPESRTTSKDVTVIRFR
jgi:hypothetical protein